MSENQGVGETSGTGLVDVTEGEFAGWQVWQSDAFEQRAGPFYEKRADDGSMIAAFRAEQRHMNGAGFMHGGCLMTFADSAIFTIARDALGDSHGVTLTLTGDFLDPVRVGQLVEATGEVVRAGGKTIFVAGIVRADGNPVLRLDGIIRKVRGER
ncbi:PaaI family thioesterase [Citromicrobium bathyomarinum]|uniref:PaaI family thioesterase n=1 Tax=Citromicrobium bathyomarinum TaxID=72174 RepID=UPI00315AA519